MSNKKVKEKSGNTAESPAASAPGDANDLDVLRNVLFGNQARATDQRLNGLEDELESARREFHNALNEQSTTLRETAAKELTAVHKELSNGLKNQAKALQEAQKEQASQLQQQDQHQAQALQSLQKELTQNIEKLGSNLQSQLRQTQKELSERLDKLNAQLTERIRTAQNESRQRDDDLRQELLTLGAWLDDKKTSRHTLGDMLIGIGQQLQAQQDGSSADGQDE